LAGWTWVPLRKEKDVARKVVSIAHLKELLAEREKGLAGLEARRKKLATELRKVEADTAQMQGESKEGLGPAVAGPRRWQAGLVVRPEACRGTRRTVWTRTRHRTGGRRTDTVIGGIGKWVESDR
jgi:hypothetical protein